MSARTNELGQLVGLPVDGWTAAERPPRTPMIGRYCRLEPIDADRHGPELFEAYSADTDGRNWTYLPVGPFDRFETFDKWMRAFCLGDDFLFFTVIDGQSAKAVGIASYLRIDPANGSIEVGFISFSPALQRTPASTEAMYLMMARVFDELGYRRYEWKCDSLNAPSNAAAKRLGFLYEGLFRQATVYKGRNRDTTWYSIIDTEWPAVKKGFEKWLAPENFDADGAQVARLSTVIEAARGES